MLYIGLVHLFSYLLCFASHCFCLPACWAWLCFALLYHLAWPVLIDWLAWLDGLLAGLAWRVWLVFLSLLALFLKRYMEWLTCFVFLFSPSVNSFACLICASCHAYELRITKGKGWGMLRVFGGLVHLISPTVSVIWALDWLVNTVKAILRERIEQGPMKQHIAGTRWNQPRSSEAERVMSQVQNNATVVPSGCWGQHQTQEQKREKGKRTKFERKQRERPMPTRTPNTTSSTCTTSTLAPAPPPEVPSAATTRKVAPRKFQDQTV